MKYNTHKITKYLLETSINDWPEAEIQNVKHNKNTLGAILAFNTKVKEDKPGKNFNLISLLLFLDFRTARVERFIINSSNPTLNLNKKDVGVDYRKDLTFVWNNEKFNVFHDLELGIWNKGDQSTILSQIGDGKLTRKYYIYFITELLRDYLKYFTSFRNGNIASLRKLTLPIEPAKLDKNGNIVESATGSGLINNKENLGKLLHESSEYRKNDFDVFKAYNFISNKYDDINPTNDQIMTIFIPNGLKNGSLDHMLNSLNYNVVYANKGELSQLVKDFSRTLSIKTIRNTDDIVKRIKYFNYNIVRHLKKYGETHPMYLEHKNW